MAILKENKEEMPDRNKTELTHKLTALATGCLAVIGCKPIETEVLIKGGWIADVAGFTYPTMTELKQGKLLKSIIQENPATFQRATSRTDYSIAEYIHKRHLFPLTAICEVKISMADFNKDVDKKFRHAGANLNYLAVPKAISEKIRSKLDEINKYGRIWSLIICSDSGERVMKLEIPPIQSIGIGKTVDIVAQIAIRRCHRTEKAWLRDMLKEYRVNNSAYNKKIEKIIEERVRIKTENMCYKCKNKGQ